LGRTVRLLLSGALIISTAFATALLAAPPDASASATPIEAQMAREVIAQINAERAARALGPIGYDPTLAALAQSYSDQQAAGTKPPGDASYTFAQTSDYQWFGFGAAAAGSTSPSSTYTLLWMGSAGHRDTLMQNVPGQGIGIGLSCTSSGTTWVQVAVGSVTSRDPTYVSGTPALPVVTEQGSGSSCATPSRSTLSTTTGIASTPSGDGYWVTDAHGDVSAHGDALQFGGMGGAALNSPIRHVIATPDGQGYWLIGSDGGSFTFGDAGFFGSMGASHLNAPVVDLAATHSGRGYWMVASDGGVFSFGDARFLGSMGGTPLNEPVVGIVGTATDGGYWLVAADGGVFSFGDARFHGSTGSIRLNAPIASIAANADGSGYWTAAADGGIFAFDAPFCGSMGSHHLDAPIVGMASDRATNGYWLVAADGGVFGFGAPFFGSG